jgi:hypothetical protein
MPELILSQLIHPVSGIITDAVQSTLGTTRLAGIDSFTTIW